MGARDGGPLPAAFVRNVNQLALTDQELRKTSLPVEALVGDRDPVKQLYVAALRPVRNDWPVVEIVEAGHLDCITKKQFRDEIAARMRKNSGTAGR
jgi:hypothetical protein